MLACPNCGHENADGAKFCSECGANLLVPTTRRREMRKTVTVVFCDVTGSTALGERLDPESLRGVMTRYFERMQGVLQTHGGTVEKFIGDAVMAVFGIPVLHEDDALRGVRAASGMREALAELNVELEREWSLSLQARIGVNTGEVVAGDPSGGQNLVTGDAVNTAARLEQAATAGEILIGEETFHLTRDAVVAEPVDPLALKGKAEVVGAYRLLSVKAGVAGHVRRLDSPMVGRERPLRMLLDAFESASADRACHLFTVFGPAGIGKSRLVREFVSTVSSDARVLTGRCLSYGDGITFWPVTEMAIQAAGIAEDDSPESARDAIRSLLAGSSEGEVVAAHLARLIGLDAGGPVEAPWAVRRFFEASAREQPLVAVFDDIHWAEPTLLDVIEHVADRSRDVPIVLLCMARPELLDDRQGWGGGMRNATSVHLEPLSEPEADALIENLLGHPALTQEIRERIRAAAQGNPLFVEEMLAMLLDDGVLVLKEGEWVAAVDLTTVHVPPAISALLAARLDRLSNDERAVLEAASVAGEVFERSAVRELVSDSIATRVDLHLGTLLRKDLIRPSASDIGGDESFRFRHILLRDAAYDAVPKGDRAELHEAFAANLEASLGERAAEFDEFTGYHLEQAHRLRGELGVHDERTTSVSLAAFERLGAAGRRAFERSDMAAAANLLGRASELLDLSDPDRLRMAWQLGQALTESGALAEAVEVLEGTIARARDAGDEIVAGYAECILWMVLPLKDPDVDIDEWEAATDRLIELFEHANDRRGAGLAWTQKSYCLWFRWSLERSGAAAGRAVEHARAVGDRLTETDMRSHLLATLGLGPRPLPEAVEAARRTLVEARVTGDRRLEQSALLAEAMHMAFGGDFAEARRFFALSRTILGDLGRTIEYWANAQGAGRIELLAGDLDSAARELREGCEQLQALGETAFLSTTAAMLALVELRRGDGDAAEHWLEVTERTASSGDRSSQVGIQIVRGLLLIARSDPAGEHHLSAGIELLDDSDATVWRTDIRLDLADALERDRPEVAVVLAREALALAEAKQVPVHIAIARRILAAMDEDEHI
ncbi:MAG: adenylate/guanylate cyclase domain-containing protein [Actinomycetota bacterium]